MKTLKFIDMTLRQAGPSFGKVLSFKEKLEIARSLDRLRADTIELAPISGSKADQLANRTIASMVQTRISPSLPVRFRKKAACSGRASAVSLIRRKMRAGTETPA